MILTAGGSILMRKLAYRAECKERTESKRGSRVCIYQGIADEDTILVGLEDYFLLQYNTTNPVCRSRHEAGIKLTNVLVSVRTVVVALILVEPQVELSAMLYHRTVERRQEHMVLIVELGYRNNQQTVVFARITVYECRRAVCA